MKLSVIIPMYNVEQYLEKCVSSVCEQDFLEDDFELILVDDESPDNSLAVAITLSTNIKNIKIISQKNKGLGGARNTGILNATGVYLLFLDSDDWLLPNVLRELVEQAYKDNLDVLEFAAQGISKNGKVLYHVTNKSKLFNSGYEYYNSVRYMHSACNKLYKTSFLIENNLLFLENIYIEDFEFNTRVLQKVKKIKATNHLVARFLQSDNSITRTTDHVKKNKMVLDIIQVIKITDRLYKNQKNTKESQLFYLERLNFLIATLFYQLIKNKATYKEIIDLKLKLQDNEIFYINHKIFDFRKNLLRIIFLKNIWIFKWFKLFIK
jgi:glycosyltransferase involved in cell wall biosynthesis